MARITLIGLLLFSLVTGTAGQRVMDISELPPGMTNRPFPDVKGKVLVSENTLPEGYFNTQDTVTVFPLWPKSKMGYNERGGIYCNLDSDIELEIVYTIGQSVHAFNIDGSNVPGWPVSLEFYPDGAPSYGDIDGDGFGEIVVTTHVLGSFSEGKIYAFEQNGSNSFGFPIETSGGAVRTPVLADIDLDGKDEIIVAVRDWPDGFIHVYTENGTIYPGWPVRMNDVPATTVAVGDITGDDTPEIIAASYNGLYAYNPDGSILPGFPYLPGPNRVFSHSTPVLADLDGDGLREIIFGDHSSSNSDGRIHVLENDGSVFPNWPKTTEWWVYSPPSVGDLNGDGNLDIVVADYFHEIATPVNRIYAWDAQTGNALQGFPVVGVYGVFSQLLMADIDGDDNVEVMFDSNIGPQGFYYGFNHNGTPMEGWPINVIGSSFTINPFIADVNGDQILDISGGGYDKDNGITWLYLWNAHSYMNPDKNYLTILQYNTRHNGVYGDYLMVGQSETPAPDNSFSVYPVPASGMLYIHFNRDDLQGTYSLKISDLSGKALINRTVSPNAPRLEVNISGLPPGNYILSLHSGNETLSVEKIVIGP